LRFKRARTNRVCDGSDAQQKEFFDVMLREGHTVALNPQTHRLFFAPQQSE